MDHSRFQLWCPHCLLGVLRCHQSILNNDALFTLSTCKKSHFPRGLAEKTVACAGSSISMPKKKCEWREKWALLERPLENRSLGEQPCSGGCVHWWGQPTDNNNVTVWMPKANERPSTVPGSFSPHPLLSLLHVIVLAELKIHNRGSSELPLGKQKPMQTSVVHRWFTSRGCFLLHIHRWHDCFL